MVDIDSFILKAVVHELCDAMLGSKIRSCRDVNDGEVVITTNRGGLLLSCNPDTFRIHRIGCRGDKPIQPFTVKADRELSHAVIHRIDQIAFDRIVHVHIRKVDLVGCVQEYTLVAELIGRGANILLLDGNHRVVERMRKGSGARPLLSGAIYSPPAQNRADLSALDEASFVKMVRESTLPSIKKILESTFTGMGPFPAQEVLARSQVAPERMPAQISVLECKSLWAVISELYGRLHRGDIEPTLVMDGENPVLAWPFPPISLPGTTLLSVKTMNEALERWFSVRIEQERRERLVRKVSSAVQKAIARTQNLVRRQEEELATAEQADAFLARGQAILAHLPQLRRGMTEAKLLVPTSSGAKDEIVELDPALGPIENAQRYFMRYRKGQRAREHIAHRLGMSRELLDWLSGVSEELHSGQDQSRLLQIEEDLIQQGLLKATAVKRRTRASPEKRRFRSYALPEGCEVLVGRNNKENDELTFHYAHPDDLFFHARGVTGSHVILRRACTGAYPQRATIEKAAAIAAFYSKGRTSEVVPVAYTERRYVRKPKGAPPGTVNLTREKVIFVAPSLPPKDDRK